MKTITSLLLFIASLSSKCNQPVEDFLESKITIDKISKSGINEWYVIKDQFINQRCNNDVNYASVYLCIKKGSVDTTLIISPCVQNRYKINSGASLYVDNNVEIGKTIYIKIPKKYSALLEKKESLVFGTLKIPTQ